MQDLGESSNAMVIRTLGPKPMPIALLLVGAPPLVLDPADHGYTSSPQDTVSDNTVTNVLLPLLQWLLTAPFSHTQSTPKAPLTTSAAPTHAAPLSTHAQPPLSSGEYFGTKQGCPSAQDIMALPHST